MKEANTSQNKLGKATIQLLKWSDEGYSWFKRHYALHTGHSFMYLHFTISSRNCTAEPGSLQCFCCVCTAGSLCLQFSCKYKRVVLVHCTPLLCAMLNIPIICISFSVLDRLGSLLRPLQQSHGLNFEH